MTLSTQVLLDALRKMLDPNFDVVLARNYARSVLAAHEGNVESAAFQKLGEVTTSLKDRAMAYGDYLGVTDSREHAQITCAFVRGYQEATITSRLSQPPAFNEAKEREAFEKWHAESFSVYPDYTNDGHACRWEGYLAARRQENKA